jgi:hypothetical protein
MRKERWALLIRRLTATAGDYCDTHPLSRTFDQLPRTPKALAALISAGRFAYPMMPALASRAVPEVISIEVLCRSIAGYFYLSQSNTSGDLPRPSCARPVPLIDLDPSYHPSMARTYQSIVQGQNALTSGSDRFLKQLLHFTKFSLTYGSSRIPTYESGCRCDCTRYAAYHESY